MMAKDVININFEVADQIIASSKTSYDNISNIYGEAKGISADAFSSYSPSAVSLNNNFQDSVRNVVSDVENFISSFDSSVNLYREEYERIKKEVEEKELPTFDTENQPIAVEKVEEIPIEEVKVEPIPEEPSPTIQSGNVAVFTIDEIKLSEIKAKEEFYFNYKGNVKEVHEIGANELTTLLVKNGATKNGEFYMLTIDGHTYGYNPKTNQISMNGKALQMYSKFYVRNDADIDDITNTFTLLSGQDVVDRNDGPARAAEHEAARHDNTSVFDGVEAGKNGLVIVPYGREYGGQGWTMAPGVSASTRIGDFIIGGKNKKVNNSIAGFSLGGYAAYATVSQNKGLYTSLVAVNTRMRTEGNGKTILGGGSWDAFEGVDVYIIETSGDNNPAGAIKFLDQNVKNININFYGNKSEFIKTMKSVGREKNIHVVGDRSSKWYAHGFGVALLKESGLIGYLTS